MSRRVSFSPEAAIYPEYGAEDNKTGGNKERSVLKVWIFRISKGSRFSPASFFRKVKGTLPPLTQSQRRCSRKVSSASATLVRSHSYAETVDSQRAEAIEDCIEFLNSSSSLQRSNSVSSSC